MNPTSAWPLVTLGINRFDRGDYVRATAYLEMACAKDPKYPPVYEGSAMALIAQQRHKETIAILLQAPRYTPGLTYDYWLGVAYDGDGQTEKAISAFQRALENNPGEAYAFCRLAQIHLRVGMVDPDLQELEEAVRFAPHIVSFRITLADAYCRLGRLPEAIAEYRRILELDPANDHARAALAKLVSGGCLREIRK